MPSQVALYLTGVFVVWLLVRDQRVSPRTSSGLWVATIWMVILGVRPPSYWFGADEVLLDSAESHPLNTGVYAVVIAIGMIVVLRRKLDWGEVFRKNRAVMVFMAICLLSILWSEYPMVSLRQNIKVSFGHLIMALIVVSDRSPLEAIKTVIRRYAFVLIPLSVTLIKYFPDLGRTIHRYTYATMYQGVSDGPNGLAAICFVGGVVFIWQVMTKGSRGDGVGFGINMFMLGLILWLFAKADGKTAAVCLGIAIAILISLRYNIFKPTLLSVARNAWIVLAIGAPLLALNYSLFASTVGNTLGNVDTLLGRIDMWKILVNMNDSFWVGMGYGAFWVGDRIEYLAQIYTWRPNQAHNGYLETYLNLGVLGLAALVVFIVSACRKAASDAPGPEFQTLRLAYILPILLFNLNEAAFKGLSPLWFLFIVLTIEASSLPGTAKMSSRAEVPNHARWKQAATVPGGRIRQIGHRVEQP